jgi:hypothetical protein
MLIRFNPLLRREGERLSPSLIFKKEGDDMQATIQKPNQICRICGIINSEEAPVDFIEPTLCSDCRIIDRRSG